MEEKQNLKNIRNRYYNKELIIKEIVKCMKNREVVFMDKGNNCKCLRGVKILTTSFFSWFCDHINFKNENYNIYISLAQYKNIPQKDIKKWFKEESINNIESYDLLLDFDFNEDINSYSIYLLQLEVFFNFLLLNKVCFYIIPSGRYYQIILPNNIWEFKPENNKIIQKGKDIISQIKLRFNLDFLDLKGVGVHNKIMKCPYSLVNDIICIPLKEFNVYYDNFKIKNNKTDCFIDRGLCLYNDFGTEQNKINFKKFCEKNFINY